MNIIIIGGGQAAASLAQKFRSLNKEDRLVILSEEAHPPYQRPPLSKKYLAGEMELERLYLKPKNWYEDNEVELRLSTKVTGLNRAQKSLTLENGETLNYDKLVFATGARPRLLPTAMTQNAENIYAVRNLADIDQMLPAFQKDHQLIIIGGGYIGLEAAAIARKFAVDVTLIEAAPRILGRVASEATADFIRQMHQENGVNIFEGQSIQEFELKDNKLTHTILQDGSKLPLDFLIVGIGILPNIEIAEIAGIECDDGILVNEFCQTSDPDIFAAGDCTRFSYKGTHIRIESVGNAIDQGEIVAQNLAGAPARYTPKPWFWSDQYETTLQIAGLNHGYDDVVIRSGQSSESQSIWYYQGDQLLAVDALNDPRAYMIAKRVLESGKNIPKAAAKDPEADLKAFMKG